MSKNNRGLREGTTLGPYKINRLVGKGGMGEVYEAVDENLQRHVAIKIISAKNFNDPATQKRFMSEGQALARINHQNIVTVYTLGEENGILYLAMEFVHGVLLEEFSRARKPSVSDVLRLMMQILDGVRVLHESAIIHRDLKPTNIIVRKDSVAKILDFGVAISNGRTIAANETSSALVGSSYYLAPEIIAGDAASMQSDIWSLGIIFYELLLDARPFGGESRAQLHENIQQQPLLFPADNNVQIPNGLRWIILQMCQKRPQDRPASTSQIIEHLKSFERNQSIHQNGGQVPRRPVANQDETFAQINALGYTGAAAQAIFRAALEIQRDADFENAASLVMHNGVLSTNIASTSLNQAVNSHLQLDLSTASFKLHQRPSMRAIVALVGIAIVCGAFWWVVQTRSVPSQPSVQSPVVVAPPITAAPTLEIPGPNAQFAAGSAVRYIWEKTSEHSDFRFQLAMDSDFKTIVKDLPTIAPQYFSMELRPGRYFWRVREEGTASNVTSWSETRSFQVLPMVTQMPAPALPIAQAPPPRALPKPAVVAKAPPVKKPIAVQKPVERKSKVRKVANTPAARAPSMKKLVVKKRAKASETPRRLATIEIVAAPAVRLSDPVLKLPPGGSSLVMFGKSQEPIFFSWTEVADAEGYTLEISPGPGFTRIIFRTVTSKPQFILNKPLPVGTYYWRIRAANSDGRTSTGRNPLSFTIGTK